MRFAYTDDQQALKAELARYFAGLVTTEDRQAVAAGDNDTHKRLVKQMAVDGWLGLAWPRAYGGQDGGLVERFILHDEATLAGAPFPVGGVNLVGPTLMDLGTDQQRDRFLPSILSGDDFYCIGYSEPSAGTDLAAISTTATLDGTDYIVNGTKTWTSYASVATHCWLAVRTDPSEQRHAGMSVLIVPMDAPGVTATRLSLLNDHDGSTLTFDDVRVPVENLVGSHNGGWNVITRQLNHERITMGAPGLFERLYRDVRAWVARTTLSDGSSLLDVQWIRSNLAQVYRATQIMRLMSWRNIDDAQNGRMLLENISATKVFATEYGLSSLNLLLEILGNLGPLGGADEQAVAAGDVEELYRHYLHMTFGGGANEIQRELIVGARYGIRRSR